MALRNYRTYHAVCASTHQHFIASAVNRITDGGNDSVKHPNSLWLLPLASGLSWACLNLSQVFYENMQLRASRFNQILCTVLYFYDKSEASRIPEPMTLALKTECRVDCSDLTALQSDRCARAVAAPALLLLCSPKFWPVLHVQVGFAARVLFGCTLHSPANR